MIRKITDNLPSLWAILSFFGFIKLWIYYKAFNITISQFIEFPEILVSFMPDAIYLVLMMIGVVFIINSYHTDEIGYIKYISKKNFQQRLGVYIFEYFDKFTIPTSLILFFVTRNYGWLIMFFYGIGYDLFVLITSEVRLFYFKEHAKDLEMKNASISLFLYFYFVFFFISVFSDIEDVKVKHKYCGTEIQVDNVLLISDKVNYFIGKTAKYLFYYNEKLNKTMAYPMDRIKMITFSKKEEKIKK